MKLRNCDMKTFFSRCADKKIACYGIGSVFYNFINNYAQCPWNEKIAYLVDSNPERFGEEILLGSRMLSIMNLDALLEEDTSDFVLLITCGFFAELVKQLNKIPQLAQTECYIYDFMPVVSDYQEFSIRQEEICLIPPTIHYCWFGRNEMQDLHKRCIESWHKFCPDYKIIEWNEDNCNISENLFAKQAYGERKYGFVPDYFRLKIIYEHGGIYLDTDVEVIRSLDDLRFNEAFCGMQRPGEVNLGLGFGAVAGCGIIKKLLERYKNMQFLKKDGSFDETASPIWQTRDLLDMGMQYGNYLQKISRMTIYPVEVLSPKNVASKILRKSENTYSIHHFDGSWLEKELLFAGKAGDDMQNIYELFLEN